MEKDFRFDTWEDFNKCIQNKDLYIWGAGGNGRHIVQNMKRYSSVWNLKGFIDIDTNKEVCEGYPVITPDIFSNIDIKSVVVLISVNHPRSIAKRLEVMGVKDYFSFFWLNARMKDVRKQNDIDEPAILAVKKLLADDTSRNILEIITEKRKTGFMDYTDITGSGTEYFIDDFFSPRFDEVFVDAGGYDGDTIEEFVDWTKNKYDAIYSFEPDKRMYDIIKGKMHRWHDVHLFNNGLWSEKISLPFKLDNYIYSSKISDLEADTEIECVNLDSITEGKKVTFIKMDIEGAEIPAIYGASNTILKNKL